MNPVKYEAGLINAWERLDHVPGGAWRWGASLLAVLAGLALAGGVLWQPPPPPPAAASAMVVQLAPAPLPVPAAPAAPAPAPPKPVTPPPPRPVIPAPPPPAPAVHPEIALPSRPEHRPAPPRPVQPEQPVLPEQPAPAAPPAPPQAAAPADPGAVRSWQGDVLARLEACKRYPDAAEDRHQEGVPVVRFSMDRSGQVLSVTLVKSAGFAALDAEALAVIRRAAPLPAPPPGIPGAVLTLTVPVQFSLDDDD